MTAQRVPTRGASTVEALVCLLLTMMLAQLSWSLLLAARRTAGRMIERSEALETERVGWHVLSVELGAGVAGRDWSLSSPKVLPLRAFRGSGEVCAEGATPEGALVRYRGIRLPEPEKDSLLVLTSAGDWRTVKLVGRSPTPTRCPDWPEEVVERWQWSPQVDGVLLARVFERGSYHLEDRALRYRLAGGGRQPLTVERVERGSEFTAARGGVDLRLEVRVDKDVVWESTRRLNGGGGAQE